MIRKFIYVICLLTNFALQAQVSLTVEVSADTIGVEDVLKVTYKLVGGQGRIEVLPLEEMRIVQGPNISSSFSFVNGQSSQEYAESYVLAPMSEGTLYIPSASTVIDGTPLETDPVEIIVLPDPNYTQKKEPTTKQTTIKDSKTSEENEAEYQRLIKKRALAKKKKKF